MEINAEHKASGSGLLKLSAQLSVFLLILFISCDSRMVFEKNEKLPGAVWGAENKIIFETRVSDTVSLHNLYINIRNNGKYPFSNLYVFIDMFTPDGKIQHDTIECILTDIQGHWLGKSGSGSVWENHILFKQNIRFPKTGKYVFRFEQAMRTKDLEHILDVGLRVERGEI